MSLRFFDTAAREVRDFDRILSHAALAALATAIAGVIIALTWRARRWAMARLAALMSQGGAGLTIPR